MYIGGKNVSNYEDSLKKFFSKKYIASCNSGTDALILSLVALGIKPGDEVILHRLRILQLQNQLCMLVLFLFLLT